MQRPIRLEQAKLAYQDSKAMQELADELSNFSWAVEACGDDGKVEMEKVRERARDCIKRLVNYI